MAGLTMQVNIVAADHPVWHGTAKSVTIPASEGGMGILPKWFIVHFVSLVQYEFNFMVQFGSMRVGGVGGNSPVCNRIPAM